MKAHSAVPDCTVIGAGAWGSTLATILGRRDCRVRLWARREEVAAEIERTRMNSRYLLDVQVPANVEATSDLEYALDGVSAVIIAVPSVGLRAVACAMAPLLAAAPLVICATKGLERESGKRMSVVLAEELGLADPRGLVALSGPNLSREIALGIPAVTTVASSDRAMAERAQQLLDGSLFRVYTNCDIIGVELGGALKNVIAVGAGISDGLGYGDNAKASLITRGLAEISRLGRALGAMPETFWGIAGVGDLVATCSSKLSRNWQLGNRAGRGEAVDAIISSMYDVAEGYFTTRAACERARDAGVDAPIIEGVHEVLYENGCPETISGRLMSREPRSEHEPWHGVENRDW